LDCKGIDLKYTYIMSDTIELQLVKPVNEMLESSAKHNHELALFNNRNPWQLCMFRC